MFYLLFVTVNFVYEINFNIITMDLYELFETSENLGCITLEVTVASGFESLVMLEINEKIASVINICKTRGRVFFSTSIACVEQVLKLRSIDHVYLVISVKKDMDFPTETSSSLTMLECLIENPNWKKVVDVWKQTSHFKGICFPSLKEYFTANEKENNLKQEVENICAEKKCVIETAMVNSDECSKVNRRYNYKEKRNELKQRILCKADRKEMYRSTDRRLEEDKVLKFRMTCYRTGKHNFSSPEVACSLGGKLQEKFHWVVDLVYHDLEMVINVKENEAYGTISLTKDSLHKRNVQKFGPTTLRATVCYNLLQLASPTCADIVVDPLCGGASIPIESTLAFTNLFNIGGDNHPLAISRAHENVQFVDTKNKGYVDLAHWDVTRLPLKDACVDVLVTDLPFGKRLGSKQNNQVLYQKAMLEMARCIVPAGRAVCLTWDKTNLSRTIRAYNVLWSVVRIVSINLGGLKASAYVLRRTSECVHTFLTKLKLKGKKK